MYQCVPWPEDKYKLSSPNVLPVLEYNFYSTIVSWLNFVADRWFRTQMWHCAFKFHGSNAYESWLNPSGRKTRTSSVTTRQATRKVPLDSMWNDRPPSAISTSNCRSFNHLQRLLRPPLRLIFCILTFWRVLKPPFGVTLAEVVINCPE